MITHHPDLSTIFIFLLQTSKYSELVNSIVNSDHCNYIIGLDRSIPLSYGTVWKPVNNYIGSDGFGLNGSNTMRFPEFTDRV